MHFPGISVSEVHHRIARSISSNAIFRLGSTEGGRMFEKLPQSEITVNNSLKFIRRKCETCKTCILFGNFPFSGREPTQFYFAVT